MRLTSIPFAASAIALIAAGAAMAAPAPAKSGKATKAAATTDAWTPPADPYIWLEDVNGERSMNWVHAENAKTLGVLEKDPRFEGLFKDAVKIAEAKDKIAYPGFLGGEIYNFWQDADHVQGVWRKTSFDDYQKSDPHWTTVIDMDALSKANGKHLVFDGANCLRPGERYCLISLSDGGEDATTEREFDLKTGEFIEDGFTLPHSKQDVTWEDQDHLLVARDWGAGSMTDSGYAYIVKRVTRGQPLDKALEVYRGTTKDVSVRSFELRDGAGNHAMMIDRGVSFFESEYYLVTPSGVKKVGLPLKAGLHGMIEGRVLVEPKQDWTTAGKTWKAGTLLSLNLSDIESDPAHLKPTLVYTPGPRESIAGMATTRDRLIMATYENVRGRLHVYTPVTGGGWTKKKLDLPDNASLGVAAADEHSERAFVTATGFLDPSTLYLLDASTGALTKSKALPARFDASNDVVEQHEATSTDGTKIPYFIVHKKGLKLDGKNPTIQYAYGGFESSMTPGYNTSLGKLWLERGGVYVLANIRGGGEFGPKWHEAGLKTKRQIIYDDFAAVAKDLIARKITTPRHLGIQGGSNGGLLMGVEFTQHPELWNAVDIQVPLLDMIRFEKIAAGASWVGEYGSMSVPKERAFWLKNSPYNALKADRKYPEPLIWTTTKDDRVGPQHARKFAARMAEYKLPYMYYEVTEGGHGSGANLKEKARTTALEYTYFIRKLAD
jgi:prolyl oligopeptidase